MAEPIPPADPTTGTWRLKQIGLAKLLHNLSISERTGTLVLKRGEVSKSIFFKNGYVMFAESNLATDRLGEVLCRRGEITRAQLSECLAESKRTGKMLGAVLVEKTVLRAERLLPAIEVQVREIVLGAFSWDDGEYLFSKEFFGNTEDLLDLKIRSADLILEGVRRTYTATQASKTLGDTSRPPKLSAESGYLSQELTVNFETSKVLSKIDGQRSIAQVVAETGLTELTVLQILAALAHLKILDVESAGNTAAVNVSPASVPSPPAPPPAPGATDVRVRAARVEEMRAHDEVTQLLDRLPPLVSQLLFDANAATPQVLAAAGPDADAIGRSFGNGRRILDVLQERNYTLELVRAVAHLYSVGALKATQGAPASGNGWQQATPAGGGWQSPAAPAGGAPAQPPASSWQVPGGAVPAAGGAPAPANVGFPASKPAPPPAAAAPPMTAGFPATKADPASAGFPAAKPMPPPVPAAPAVGFGAPTPGSAWGAPVAPPPLPPPAPSNPWNKSAAIPLGGGAPVPAPPPAAPPSPAPPAPAASQPWAKPPEPRPPAPPPQPVSSNAPIPMPPGPAAAPPPSAPAWAAPSAPPPPPASAGWGAPVAATPAPAAVPPTPAAPSMPWAQPPAPAPIPAPPFTPAPAAFAPPVPPSPAPSSARPTGPAVWNVPSAPSPAPPTAPVVAPPAPAPAPAPTPAPQPPALDLLEIAPDDVKSIDVPAPPEPKPQPTVKPTPPKTDGGRRSRAPFAILGLLLIGGGVVGGSYAGVIPLEIPGITPPRDPAATPVAAVTPTPDATATPAPSETAVASVDPTPETTPDATPEPTATVAATATPTATPKATAVAIVATPKPTPAPTKAPEDPEAKKKKAAGQVKSGNEALNAGDGAKAVKYFTWATINDPTNADAHLGLGTAHMLSGNNAKAKRAFQKFLQIAPNHQYAAQTRQILGSL